MENPASTAAMPAISPSDECACPAHDASAEANRMGQAHDRHPPPAEQPFGPVPSALRADTRVSLDRASQPAYGAWNYTATAHPSADRVFDASRTRNPSLN